MTENIRNFSIIAHIDHGKSTLADRILEHTGAISGREKKNQFLDKMDIERERGITIKAQTVRMTYNNMILNLIDTPGHVDFSYEVSRSLAACEGALLIIDASQGIEAQTLANFNLARENGLRIIPVINKIDMSAADPEGVKEQIEKILGMDPKDVVLASAKKGIGTEEVLDAVIEKIPAPKGDAKEPLKALLFDSWFDSFQGVIILVRIFDGTVRAGTTIKLLTSKNTYEVDQVGIFSPYETPVDRLTAGDVGYIIAGIKTIKDTKIGDTITDADNPAQKPLPGYKNIKPMVFSGIYPIEGQQYDQLRNSLEKLHLNDSSFQFEPETSLSLGFGFRCGFLGLLHMDIIRERLEREFLLSLLNTSPNVKMRITRTNGEVLMVENPYHLPKPHEISRIEEPYITGTILTSPEFVGNILKLCETKRGTQKKLEYLDSKKVKIVYELPLSEIISNFYDRIKSASKGYASFDYEFIGYKVSDLVKIDILINTDPVDALSTVIHREKAYAVGKELVLKIRSIIPRQMFEVVIQAAIGNKIIARDSVRALRKDVTAKCYGGDITRKRKLLEKQREGKKRMRQLGKVEIPQEAFMSILEVK
jgi:GTP-binding protein LepA